MVTKLIAHYETIENLEKELDRKMRGISRKGKKRTLEEIKRAEEELEKAGEKYRKAIKDWVLEINLVRRKLKLELMQPEETLSKEESLIKTRLTMLEVNILRAILADERWEFEHEFKQRRKIIKWEKCLKQISSIYDIFLVIEKAPEEVKEKAWEKFLEQNPDKHDLDLIITFAPEKYKTKAQEVLQVLNKEIYV